MKKLAISYYYSIFDGISGIRIHDSGKEAVEEIESASKSIFRLTRRGKKHLIIPSKGQVTIGYGITRSLLARFLTTNEVEIYKKYGEQTCYTDKNNVVELCAPDQKNNEVNSNG